MYRQWRSQSALLTWIGHTLLLSFLFTLLWILVSILLGLDQTLKMLLISAESILGSFRVRIHHFGSVNVEFI